MNMTEAVRIYIGRNVDAELRPNGMVWLKQKDGPILFIDHGSVRLLWNAVEAYRGQSHIQKGER